LPEGLAPWPEGLAPWPEGHAPEREGRPASAKEEAPGGARPSLRYDDRVPRARLALLVVLGLPSSAWAQTPAPSPAPPAVATDAPAPSADALSLPLRLSILSSVYSYGPTVGPRGCGAESVAMAGTIFPTQPYTQIQLTPRLTLHGFSDLGCPGDRYAPLSAGAGAGLTYTVPLTPHVWLVASAGTYAVPAQRSTMAAGGLDLVIPQRNSNAVTAGVGVVNRRVMVRGGRTF
jgi:hypothetical protein